ncbi:MAG TPA: hypothetical protein VEK32_11740 [Thermodesulfobacteriota bacterium]|nr:hypothetical protein [Thermodesulfobacteriota bacterium]
MDKDMVLTAREAVEYLKNLQTRILKCIRFEKIEPSTPETDGEFFSRSYIDS